MEDIQFEIKEADKYTIINYFLPKPIEPEKLKLIVPPKVNPQKGVIISGKGPIWLYGFLIHHYHSTKFVATYDPRLGGGVIVESHSPDWDTGDTIKVEINY